VFTAVVRVSGAGRLADFRERLRWLMVRDADAEDYTEHHGEGLLEYRFQPKLGIPFPAFTEASAEYPELTVEAEWERDGVRGRALIESGRVVEQSAVDPGAPGVAVEVAEDGRLALGIVCMESGDACTGYAATADRHTFFRFSGTGIEFVEVEQADAALEEVAFAFIDEWIWFDESTGDEAELERTRYAGYGYCVRGANLKSEKLAFLRRSGGRWSTLSEAGRKAREALLKKWPNPT
jgi:hypothetical protein